MKIGKEMNSVMLIRPEATAPSLVALNDSSTGTAVWAGLASPACGHNRPGWPMPGGVPCPPEPWSPRSGLAWRRGHRWWYRRRGSAGWWCENEEGKRDVLGNKGAGEAHRSVGSMCRRWFGPTRWQSQVVALMRWSSATVRGFYSFRRSAGFRVAALWGRGHGRPVWRRRAVGGGGGSSNPFNRWRSLMVGVDIRSPGSVGEGDDALWGKKSHRQGRISGGSRWLSVGAEKSKMGREWGLARCWAMEDGVGSRWC
jgi:hypothetical protein